MEHTFHMLIYRAFHAQRSYLRPQLDQIGLGAGQPKLLAYLDTHRSCTQRELADYFEIDPAAVSRMTDSLERGGFITRTSCENNRRCGMVGLTDKGSEANRRWQVSCRTMERRMLDGFTEEEQTQFADYLSRAYQNLKSFQKGEDEP